MSSKLVERRLNDFKRRCGKDGDAALQLAYHAAMPVALNPELLHFLRINFFLDPPEQLPYTVEFEFLNSGLCREIDAELYEIEPEIRNELLQGLMRREDAHQRIRDIATLLWQYVEHHSPWADRVELERAQQLTALNFLDPAKAKQWLEEAEANPSIGRGEREWFIAMRQEYQQALELTRRLLGDEHPDFATSLNNLAELYRSQGRYAEAEALFQEALQLTRRLLGDEHASVATSLKNLANLYNSQERYAEVEPLTVAAITTLAFSKAIEKTAETLTASVLNKLNNLREKIWQRFKGNQKLEDTLANAQKEGSKADVDLISAYLRVAMDTDSKFAQDIQQLAQEINQEINIGKIEGRNVQNVYGSEAFQSNDPNPPTFQGGSGHSITFNYNTPG